MLEAEQSFIPGNDNGERLHDNVFRCLDHQPGTGDWMTPQSAAVAESMQLVQSRLKRCDLAHA
jgi:hypothetical protein